MKAMDDDIRHTLDCDARAVSYVNICSSTIDCPVAVHDELLFELNEHVTLKNYPKGLCLNDGMAQGAWRGIHWIIVAGISDEVVLIILSSEGAAAEANGTICQSLPVHLPVRVTPPTIVDWIAVSTVHVAQLSP